MGLGKECLISLHSYSEAVDMLANTHMLAPAYFIVGGTKSGEVSMCCIQLCYLRVLYFIL